MRYVILPSRALAVSLLVVFNASLAANDAALEESQPLRDMVRVEGIRAHQRALQTIAENNRNTRVAGSAGYRDSVSYVAEKMRAAGYQVRLQDFPLMLAEDRHPPELKIMGPEQSMVEPGDFASMMIEGSAEINGEVEAIDLVVPSPEPNTSTSGCEAEDFANFTPGNIALLQRGSCPFTQKIGNASAAGAAGVIIFNEGNPERTEVLVTRLGVPPSMPVLGASFKVGEQLRGNKLHGATGTQVHLKVDITNEFRQIQNIIAETAAGDANRVVAIGAHLDSVNAGPGINDNGSGSATILEIALKFAEMRSDPRNKIRFMWFGAEEFGLVGSEYYVNSLNNIEKNHILAMLNFDMLGSPNYARFVYDGDSSPLNPHGSAYIERVFLDYFSAQEMVTHPTAFNGRSDYGPFIEAGIPAGGLFSGAEGIKSAQLAQVYGGNAGAPFDPCYHRSCDNFHNTGETQASALALKSLGELSGAAVHAIIRLSNTSESIRLPQELVTAIPRTDFAYRGHLPIK